VQKRLGTKRVKYVIDEKCKENTFLPYKTEMVHE